MRETAQNDTIMNPENYIKVTKDGRSHVILAANEGFYRSQKYTVEKPTEAEIYAAFPELAVEKARVEAASEAAKDKAVIDRLRKSNNDLVGKLKAKDAEIEELKKAAKPDEETEKELAEARKTADTLQGEKDKLEQEKKELEEKVNNLEEQLKAAKAEAAKKTTKTTK